MSDKAMVVATPSVIVRKNASLFADIAAFEDGQRMATMLSQAKLVPEHFRKNLPDCMLALELANRIGASPMAVMQNTFFIGQKPGYSATFVIATINTCGRFSQLRYEMTGEGEGRAGVAFAYDLQTQEKLIGPEVSIAMAKAEGWFQKKGSKWQTMPELMLHYRAAAFFGRTYAPELLMGMKTTEELIDVGGPAAREVSDNIKPEKTPADLNKIFNGSPEEKQPEPEPEPEKKPKPHGTKKDTVIVETPAKEEKKAEEPSLPVPDGELLADPNMYISKLGPKELGATDPDIPFPKIQIEARRCINTLQFDKWRQNNHPIMERSMTDKELGTFFDWLNVVYDHWKTLEA